MVFEYKGLSDYYAHEPELKLFTQAARSFFEFPNATQGKFIRIHFGPQGKISGADIEYCELARHLSPRNVYYSCVLLLFCGR